MTALHADRLCAAPSRRRRRRRLWAIAEFVLTGVVVCGAGFVAGWGLGVPS